MKALQNAVGRKGVSLLVFLGLVSMISAAHAEAAAGKGAVSGVVKYDGPAPKVTFIKMNADPKCIAIHGDKKVAHEEEVVGVAGEVKNVFVYIKAGLKAEKYPVPAEPAVIDQKECMYVPRVQGMIAGQKLNVVNSDPLSHNIRCFAKVNKTFNIGQPKEGTREKLMDKPEHAIKFKCDIHGWMFAYIFVMEHPYFAVTGADGAFKIENLPPGEYTLAAWHEVYGEQEMKVKVGEGAPAKASFVFKRMKETAQATP